MILAALALGFLQAGSTIEVWRGASLATDPGVGYWDVQDTTLEGIQADTNFGGDLTLRGGPNRSILIRFGDLARVVGPKRKIISASLVLTSAGGSAPELRSVGRVQAAWGEGPLQSLITAMRGTPVDPNAPPAVTPWAATWRERRGGKITWQTPGGDAETIKDTSLTNADALTTISGLGPTVQGMIDRPGQNNGFALRFESPVEFFSAQAPKGRPKLVLEVADSTVLEGPDLSVVRIERGPVEGAEVTFTAYIKNLGNGPTEGFTATWAIGEKSGGGVEVDKKLKPGEETTVTIKRPVKAVADHRLSPLSLRITPGGEDDVPGNNSLEVQENARYLKLILPPDFLAPRGVNSRGSMALEDWVQSQFANFNNLYLAQSRFSFAPEGALERVAFAGFAAPGEGVLAVPPPDSTIKVDPRWMAIFAKGIGLTGGPELNPTPARRAEMGLAADFRSSADRFPGISGYGDTRFEGAMPYSLSLPYEPFANDASLATQLEATGLLCATDVNTINSTLSGTPVVAPKTILLRIQDLLGRPVPNAELALYPAAGGKFDLSAAPKLKLSSGTTGTCLLPAGSLEITPDLLVLVRLTALSQTDWAYLKGWQLFDSASRGSRSVCMADLRFNVSDSLVDPDTNLATDRIVTDSTSATPAQLATLLDGRPETGVTLGDKVGDWVEIDLGRDRTIGEIRLTLADAAFWSRFDIVCYATGTNVTGQTPVMREADWDWTRFNRGDGKSVGYRVPVMRVRYIRVINRAGGPGKLAEISVAPARLGG